MNNKEVAQKIVDRIVDLIEQGQPLPWVKPWGQNAHVVTIVDGEKVITINPTAWNRHGKPYRGANTYLPKGEYITYKQCAAEGGKVKKGAKGWPVVYWNFKEVKEHDEQTGEDKIRRVPILKYYTVFRVTDCEGIEQKHNPKPRVLHVPITHTEVRETPNGSDLNQTAEEVIADYIARAGNGFYMKREKTSDRAYYSPSADYVKVPTRAQFSSLAEYYSTIFHELGHSTGHSTRLNRFTGEAATAHFGSESYSREELVAESCAASILNAIGLEDEASFRNSAAYIKSWASHIKEDPLMYVTAATRAQAAVDLILGVDAEETDAE